MRICNEQINTILIHITDTSLQVQIISSLGLSLTFSRL